MLPAPLLRAKVLKPMRFMAGGTVQAAIAALEHGWAVNLGGGMHHAFFDDGGGWCCFDDISLALCLLHEASQGAFHRGMIIDLDVHQGNGHERSKLHRQKQHGVAPTHSFKHLLETFIVDVYNAAIYPLDVEAKAAIDVGVPLQSGTGDDEFLEAVDRALKEAFCKYPEPQLVVYNAGTDVLSGDPLGLMQVNLLDGIHCSPDF
jgi:histone deacetylase 11